MGWEWLLIPVVLWELCPVQIDAPSPGCEGTAGGALGTCGSWSQFLPGRLHPCTQGQHFFSPTDPSVSQEASFSLGPVATHQACCHALFPLWKACSPYSLFPDHWSFLLSGLCVPYLILQKPELKKKGSECWRPLDVLLSHWFSFLLLRPSLLVTFTTQHGWLVAAIAQWNSSRQCSFIPTPPSLRNSHAGCSTMNLSWPPRSSWDR